MCKGSSRFRLIIRVALLLYPLHNVFFYRISVSFSLHRKLPTLSLSVFLPTAASCTATSFLACHSSAFNIIFYVFNTSKESTSMLDFFTRPFLASLQRLPSLFMVKSLLNPDEIKRRVFMFIGWKKFISHPPSSLGPFCSLFLFF